MLTRDFSRMRGAKLAVATAVALLAALALLISLFERVGMAEVSLLPPDQIGAQASADVKFADLAPRNREVPTRFTSTRTGKTTAPTPQTTVRIPTRGVQTNHGGPSLKLLRL